MALQWSGAAPKVEDPQRMALQWQKDPQRMALQWSGAAPAVEGPAEDGSAMEAASAQKKTAESQQKKKNAEDGSATAEGPAEDGSAM